MNGKQKINILTILVLLMSIALCRAEHGWEYVSSFRQQMYPAGFIFTSEDEGWIGNYYSPGVRHILNGGENYEIVGVPGISSMDIFFVDPDTGWVVGDYGFIVKTCDGGESWDVQHRGDFGIEEMEYPIEFRDIEFINSNEGWAVGGYGIMISISTYFLVKSLFIRQMEVKTGKFSGGTNGLHKMLILRSLVSLCR